MSLFYVPRFMHAIGKILGSAISESSLQRSALDAHLVRRKLCYPTSGNVDRRLLCNGGVYQELAGTH